MMSSQLQILGAEYENNKPQAPSRDLFHVHVITEPWSSTSLSAGTQVLARNTDRAGRGPFSNGAVPGPFQVSVARTNQLGDKSG